MKAEAIRKRSVEEGQRRWPVKFQPATTLQVPETGIEAITLRQPIALEQPRARICEARLAVQRLSARNVCHYPSERMQCDQNRRRCRPTTKGIAVDGSSSESSDEAMPSPDRHGGERGGLRFVTFVHSDVKVRFRYQAITPTTVVAPELNFYVRLSR